MRRNNLDLWVVSLLALVAMATGWAGIEQPVVRLLVGLPLALVLPGYTCMRTLFRRTLAPAEQIVLSLGLSLALTVVAGLFLNYTVWGLNPMSWTMVLGLLTLLFSALGIWQVQEAPTESEAARTRIEPRHLMGFGLTVVLVVAAFLVARNGVAQQPEPRFTQLWLLPETAQQGTVRVGVRNLEATPTTYRLQLADATSVLQSWPELNLAANQSWDTTLALPSNLRATQTLTATLYRLDQPLVVYRYVVLAPSQTPAGSRP